MKKLVLSLAALVSLSVGSLSAQACDCDKSKEANHTAHNTTPSGKAEKVNLEGKVVTVGCPLEADAAQCTGVVLVVGEEKHMIKKARKGQDLARKAKDSDKVVKVTGSKKGEYLTVESFEIKG